PSALSRPRLLRLCPPSVVKLPPTRIFPSACTANELTWRNGSPAPGLKLVSSVPSALSRPRLLRLCPPSVVKLPPTRIFPSACTANELTWRNGSPAPVLDVLPSVPSALSRPRLLRLCPPSVVKLPPTRIFPSACTARENTTSFVAGPAAPGLKPRS